MDMNYEVLHREVEGKAPRSEFRAGIRWVVHVGLWKLSSATVRYTSILLVHYSSFC